VRTPPSTAARRARCPAPGAPADARARRRWPFLVGFTVTGGIFLNIALGITGAARCLQAARCLPCRGRALPLLLSATTYRACVLCARRRGGKEVQCAAPPLLTARSTLSLRCPPSGVTAMLLSSLYQVYSAADALLVRPQSSATPTRSTDECVRRWPWSVVDVAGTAPPSYKFCVRVTAALPSAAAAHLSLHGTEHFVLYKKRTV